MLAATATLPSIRQIVNPEGADGAIAGFGVPLAAGADKSDLGRPLERGVYALSSKDQKTIVKLRVFSKEEARFDPTLMLDSAQGRVLSGEVRQRISATWSILQLTFESYDPALYPALKFFLKVAQRIGLLCSGVVADPLAEAYRLPNELLRDPESSADIDVRNFVSVRQDADKVRTAGLAKFDQPEICLGPVSEAWRAAAESFLLSVSHGVLLGRTLEPGDKLVSESGWVVANPVNPTHPSAQSARLELVPVSASSVEEALSEWMGQHGH